MRKLFLFFLFFVFSKWHFLENKKMLFSPFFIVYRTKKSHKRTIVLRVFSSSCFLVLLFKWDMSFLFFIFFLSCVVSFFIFLVYIFPFGCWEKWGTRKKKKIPDFSRFSVLIFLELFCSRKTKNLLKDMEDKKSELLIERVVQVIFFSVLKKMRDCREWG